MDKQNHAYAQILIDSLYGIPKQQSAQASAKPTSQPPTKLTSSAIKHFSKNVSLEASHIYVTPEGKIILSKSKLAAADIMVCSKRPDVLLVCEEILKEARKVCESTSYSHEYKLVLKCMKFDNICGKAVYEFSYCEKICKGELTIREDKTNPSIIIENPYEVENVFGALKIAPYSVLGDKYKSLREQVLKVETINVTIPITKTFTPKVPFQEVITESCIDEPNDSEAYTLEKLRKSEAEPLQSSASAKKLGVETSSLKSAIKEEVKILYDVTKKIENGLTRHTK